MKIRKTSKLLLVLVVIFAWLLQSFPQIPNFPPKLKVSVQQAEAIVNNGYSFRRLIDITDAQVSSGPHTNFPILFSSTIADLKTTANGGDVTDAQGDDIIFTDSDGSTQISHEVENYVATTGELVAWVRVPSLAATSTIYIYYGNSSVTTFQGSVPGSVWNTNYQAVWHLKETTGGTDALKDSTSNNQHGTDVNTPTLGATGKIYKAVDFLDPNTNRRVDTKDFMDAATALTLEAWINPKAAKGSRIIYKHAGDNLSAPVFGLGYNTTNGIQARGRNTLGSSFDIAGGSAATINTWSHGAMTYDGSNVRVYLNGSEVTSVAFTGTLESDTDPVVLAANGTGTSFDRYFPGIIDEARVSNIARSAGWLLTGFNNQNSPSGFYTVGAETVNSAFTQSAYRFFQNVDSTNVGVVLANQDTAATLSFKPWWNTSWTRRRKIHINNSAQAENLANFPVLVSLTSSRIDYAQTQNSGQDIRFIDADGATVLKHEIEKWDETGTSSVWVKVPQIDASSTTDYIYMYYGNASVTDGQDITNVWDTNFKGVWHSDEASGTTLADSTSNANTGTKLSATEPNPTTSGKVDGAQDYDGTNDYVDLTSIPTATGTKTVSFWMYSDNVANTKVITYFSNTGSENVDDFIVGTFSSKILASGDNATAASAQSSTISSNTWYHVTVTKTTSDITNIYINGAQDTNATTATLSGAIADGIIGASHYQNPLPQVPFGGLIDEIRLSDVARSAAYISADYKSQNDTYLSYGVEETTSTTGDMFRLRMLLHIGHGQLVLNGENLKLQFAQKSGTCDTAFSGESYADVTASSVIAYNNNTTPADGDNLTSNSSDPTHSADTIVNQDYEELNNFTNSVAAIASGQDGKWDFSLIENGATASTDYCFRAVKSDGTVLDTYTVIPQITASSQFLSFSISDNTVGFGTLSTSAARYATGDTNGSASETEAHTLIIATNASAGYTATVNGTALTSGAFTISAIGATNTASSTGTEQFGLRMTASGGSGTVSAPYAASGFALDTASFPDEVASASSGSSSTTYSVRYLGNIGTLTEAGSYSATLTYVVTGNF